MAYGNHWLPGFNFNVEEWFVGDAGDMPLAKRRARGTDLQVDS